MFRHQLTIAWRSLLRNTAGTFYINLLGLAAGLAGALAIYLWINDELSFDKYHAKDSRLFQVMENRRAAEGINTQIGTSPMLAEALRSELPEVEFAVSATRAGFFPAFTLGATNKSRQAVGKYAGRDFFRLFSYGLTSGTPGQVLADRNAIVLSEELATQLFGTPARSMGQTVDWQLADLRQTCVVSGVFSPLPRNSSERFDFVRPFDSFKELMHITGPIKWEEDGPFVTYLTLKEGANSAQFNAKLKDLLQRKSAQAQARTLFIRPYSAAYLHGTYVNGVPVGGRIEYVWLFGLIAGLILVIACVNFMNLATAKASRRLKEVGIQKVLGAGRATLVGRYLTESVLMAFLALLAAVVLVQLLLPQFNALSGKQLSLTWEVIPSFLAITLVTGLAAGSYPAGYLSGLNTLTVLKGTLPSAGAERRTRQGLVVLQFALSVVFIVAVWVVNGQLAFAQRKDPGYDRTRVVYFETGGGAGQHLAGFLAALKQLPGVVSATGMWGGFVGDRGTGSELEWEGQKLLVHYKLVNYDFLETMGIQLKEGRNFSRDFSTDSGGIVVNEAVVNGLGMRQPVGQLLDGRRILGVTNDFHYESLHEKIKPLIFCLEPQAGTLLVKLAPQQERATLHRIQRLYAQYSPSLPFDYHFMDADYQAQYAAERRVAVLARYAAGLAVLISCLGLLGLAAFTAERRRKEIGIRKTLGASTASIVRLLTFDLAGLVLVGIGLALPLSYVVVEQWLSGFAYRIDLPWWYFGGSGFAALLIALLTVSFQALKAALANPVKSLRAD
ncbi:MAG: ABC transporter permease [Hymenobacteraceae bacterium]|nr:ABC transporter permease [Hymenobacteraceae bacterium]